MMSQEKTIELYETIQHLTRKIYENMVDFAFSNLNDNHNHQDAAILLTSMLSMLMGHMLGEIFSSESISESFKKNVKEILVEQVEISYGESKDD